MSRQRSGPRVLGPYRHRNKWQLHLLGFGDPGSPRTTRTFATENQAVRMKALLEREIAAAGQTIEDALKKYKAYKIRKGNKPKSATTTIYRLRSIFDVEEPLTALTAARCQKLYDKLSERVAVDTHRNTLAEAKTFCNWLVKGKQLSRNPFDDVEPMGRRAEGKEQLTIDEVRTWVALAHELAEKGNVGAIGNLTAFYLGMRPGEVVARTVRDLDDDGRILWIRRGKTKKSQRYLEIPEPLRPLLLKRAAGKGPHELLFPFHREWVNKNTRRLCAKAGVPRVVAHSLRGLHSTLAHEAGATGHMVAEALGHTSFRVTQRHYLAAGSSDRANQQRTLETIGRAKRGKRPTASAGTENQPCV